MILCWYLEADGKPSVGAGSWMFLGIPETGATGNFVSEKLGSQGLWRQTRTTLVPCQKLFLIPTLWVFACSRRQVSCGLEELA